MRPDAQNRRKTENMKLDIKRFIKFSASSLTSAGVDLLVFGILCRLLRGKVRAYIAVATVIARIISACFNYTLNHKLVFHSTEKVRTAGTKYGIVAVVKVGLSAALVSGAKILLPSAREVVLKMIVDTTLFVVSYYAQKTVVFKTEIQS